MQPPRPFGEASVEGLPSSWGLERRDGRLSMDGHDLTALASAHGTPLHVVSANALRARCAELSAAFGGFPRAVRIRFSYKTNPVPGVLRVIHSTGLGAEVVDGHELWLAERLGVAGADVVFNGPFKPDDELRAAVTEQVKEILWSVFDWESARVTFQAGPSRSEEAIRLDIPTPQAILDGVKQMKDPKRCVGRLGPSWSVFEKGSETPERLELSLSPAERLFLGRVDGTRSLRDLVGQGPGDVALNARILYAFWVLKLILRRELTSGIRKLQWRTGSGSSPASGSGS